MIIERLKYRSRYNYPNILITGTAYLIILFFPSSLNVQFQNFLGLSI